MGGDGSHLVGVERLGGIVDLQIAESQIRQCFEGLLPIAGDVGEGEVGLLGAVQGRNLAIGIQEVAHVHGNGPARSLRV